MRNHRLFGVVAGAGIALLATLLPVFSAPAGATTYEPINTVLGPFSSQGCTWYAEYGNYDGEAFAKVAITSSSGSCYFAEVQVTASQDGRLVNGGIAVAYNGTGWQQSQVAGNVVAGTFTIYNTSYGYSQYVFSPL